MKKETFRSIWLPIILSIVSLIVGSFVSIYSVEIKHKMESFHTALDYDFILKYISGFCLLSAVTLFMVGYIKRKIIGLIEVNATLANNISEVNATLTNNISEVNATLTNNISEVNATLAYFQKSHNDQIEHLGNCLKDFSNSSATTTRTVVALLNSLNTKDDEDVIGRIAIALHESQIQHSDLRLIGLQEPLVLMVEEIYHKLKVIENEAKQNSFIPDNPDISNKKKHSDSDTENKP